MKQASEFKCIQQDCMNAFLNSYAKHNGEAYLDWNGTQAKHLYLFLAKIKNHLININKPSDVYSVYNAYVMILELLPTDWLKRQSLSVLSGRLTEIIVLIKKAHVPKYTDSIKTNDTINANLNEIKSYLNG